MDTNKSFQGNDSQVTSIRPLGNDDFIAKSLEL
jgi:hypothetical protein